MDKKRSKRPAVLIVVLILIVLAGVLFYYLALPKLAMRYMRSDRAPEFVKELNRQIEGNSVAIQQSLSSYGVSNKEAADIITSIEYDDIVYIQTELNNVGYKDKEECADIILSCIESEGVDKKKLKLAIVENLSVDQLRSGMDQLSKINPAVVKAAFPVIKKMAGQTLTTKK
ncbi:MAG: hypothetical protein K9L66_13010 [Spirochaetaceae bacterium]|nr:hypothetical protein [Spirochaetaceae bacterium]